jgi:hypothetical protein
MSGERDRMRALLHELVDLACNDLDGRDDVADADEVMLLNAETAKRLELELRPLQRLAKARTLRTTRVGRHLVTTRRWLLECLDALPRWAVPRVAREGDDALAKAVTRAATRRTGGMVVVTSRGRR